MMQRSDVLTSSKTLNGGTYAERVAILRGKASQFLATGATRAQLLDSLEELRVSVRDGSRPEEDESAILDVMDALAGWTSPQNRL